MKPHVPNDSGKRNSTDSRTSRLSSARPLCASDVFDRFDDSNSSGDEADDKKLAPSSEYVRPLRGQEPEGSYGAPVDQSQNPSTSLLSPMHSGETKRKRIEHSAASSLSQGPPTKRRAELLNVEPEGDAGSATDPTPDTLLWDLESHRSFCSALFEIGLSHASPSVLLESMEHRHEGSITSERIKSHLQKYRKNKQKSSDEFWAQYDAFLSIASPPCNAAPISELASLARAVHSAHQSSNRESEGVHPLLGGHLAGFLTTAVRMADASPAAAITSSSSQVATQRALGVAFHPWTMDSGGNRDVVLPVLTEREQASPLGQSITQTFGLFHSMCRHVVQQRMISDVGEEINVEAAINAQSSDNGLDDEIEWAPSDRQY